MRKRTTAEKRELKLLDTACNMIGFLGLSTHSVRDLDPLKFSVRTSGLSAKLGSDEFSLEKLTEIAGQSLKDGPTLFRQTTIRQVNEGQPVGFQWTGGSDETRLMLTLMARLTLVAAMYDILVTRRWIAVAGEGSISQTMTYRPLHGTIKFVESHRLKASSF